MSGNVLCCKHLTNSNYYTTILGKMLRDVCDNIKESMNIREFGQLYQGK